MQGIYTCTPETNYVPKEYSVATVLLLLFMVLISLASALNLLHFYISIFRRICAVPNMAVFRSSLTSCFPGMLLTYFLNDFEIVPVAPIITGITFVFTFHMRCISVVRAFYFRIFSAFLITFLSPEIATSINIHVPFSYYYYYYYTQTQTRKVISGPDTTVKTRLLSSNRTQSGVVTGLLTGHNSLRIHLHLMGLSCSPLCRRCGAEEEASIHGCVSVKL